MAIAFDSTTDWWIWNPVTSLTFSHTCSWTNRILFVDFFGAVLADNITGVTYWWVSMTRASATVNGAAWTRYIYTYYLINPSTGTNNVVISASASIAISGSATSYNGVSQTWQPEVISSNNVNSTWITTTLTTLTSGAWTHWLFFCNAWWSTQNAWWWTTLRVNSINWHASGDSNWSVTIWSNTLASSQAGTTNWSGIMVSFAPSVLANNSWFFQFFA